MRRWLAALLCSASLCLAGTISAASAPEEAAPEQVVAQVAGFHQQLLAAMQAGADFAARSALLEPVVGNFFDFPTICRISLGRTWRQLDEAGQRQFCELLEELVVATYASRFERYSGQSFRTLSSAPAARGWVVKTELLRASGERVTLDYYFRAAGAFNVVADGVSDLSLRRADYSSIIKTDGYEGLLASLRSNIAEYQQGE